MTPWLRVFEQSLDARSFKRRPRNAVVYIDIVERPALRFNILRKDRLFDFR